MDTYIVVLRHEIDAEVEGKADSISEEGAYQLSDRVLLIRSYIDSPLPIRKLLGIRDGREGVVFKLTGAYSGHDHRSLWEWIAEGVEA